MKFGDSFSALLYLFVFSSIVHHINGMDGFNIYKDFLRGKSEEDTFNNFAHEDPFSKRLSMVFNSAAETPEALEVPISKRTANLFKNFMLRKDAMLEQLINEPRKPIKGFYIPRTMTKRIHGDTD